MTSVEWSHQSALLRTRNNVLAEFGGAPIFVLDEAMAHLSPLLALLCATPPRLNLADAGLIERE